MNKGIIDAINAWEMGFITTEEMANQITLADCLEADKVATRLDRIMNSEEYKALEFEFHAKISKLIEADCGIMAVVKFYQLMMLKD